MTQTSFDVLPSTGLKVLWHRLAAFLGLAALFLLPWVIFELTLVASVWEPSQMLGAEDAASRERIASLASTIMQGLFAGLLAVAVAWVAARDLAGEEATVPDALRLAVRRAAPAVVATVLFGIAILAMVLLGALVVVLAEAIAGALGATIGALVMAVVILYVTARLSLTPAAVALEGEGAIWSLSRSWLLTKGAVWRAFGLALVTGVVTGVVILGVGLITDGALEHLAGTVLAVALAPILPVMLTVLYRDLADHQPSERLRPSPAWSAPHSNEGLS